MLRKCIVFITHTHKLWFSTSYFALRPTTATESENLIIKNMKQKIVMKVYMNCQKCRTKALKVVAESNGVNFVGLEGEDREKVVVIGDGVDAVKLTNSLRKKVGQTDIISVAEVRGN